MSCSNCNSGCGCGNNNGCNRVGERIMVNQSSCGCAENRTRCSCANTYRPNCGCNNHSTNRCGCQRPGPRPCPPRPCPPRPCPRPSCEDRCRAQYRQCMKNCRMREDNCDYEEYEEHNCGCHGE